MPRHYLPIGTDKISIFNAAELMDFDTRFYEGGDLKLFGYADAYPQTVLERINKNIERLFTADGKEMPESEPQLWSNDGEWFEESPKYEDRMIDIDSFADWAFKMGIGFPDLLQEELTEASSKLKQTKKVNSILSRHISKEDFENHCKAPLWYLPAGLLLCLGLEPYDEYDTDLACLKQLGNYKFKHVPSYHNTQKLYQYAKDSSLIGELKLHEGLAHTQRVRPQDLIAWFKDRKIETRMFEESNKEQPSTPQSRKRENSMARVIYGMVVTKHGWDGNKPLNSILEKITGYMGDFGGIDEETLRGYINQGKAQTESRKK